MKSFAIITTAAALMAGCATAADTRAVPGFDPAASTFTGWVRVTGGEFQLFADQRQLRDRFARPCVSGALPQNAQDAARDLSGTKVEFTGRAVAWASKGDRTSINHDGSLITNQCRSDYVIEATAVRVLR